MALVDTFLPEFDHEMEGTRKIIALIPDNLIGWKAHPSLNSIGWVGSHLADTLSWTGAILNDESFDVAPPGGQPHQSPQHDSSAAILKAFDQHLASAREMIAAAGNEQLVQPWSLLQGGETVFTMPRIAVLKTFLINHVVHHRAFLVAYLRMNEIACPGLYD